MDYCIEDRQNIEIYLPLKEGQPPYAAGQYLYHPNSFLVNKYSNMEFAYEQIFVPISEAKKPRAVILFEDV
ncbi:MAG: single-stranded DNA-binding protein [Candidatus Phlomobacter fragariae]